MQVKLKINVEGLGKHGDVVNVAAALGNWLVDGRYADAADAPSPAPAKKPAAKSKAKAPAAQSISSKVTSADAGAGA